jgi:hypothetical protein
VLTARGGLKLALVVLALGVLYWPGIRHHWETAKDPYFIPFDAVQYIPPFFKFDPEDPIPTTYVKEYYLNAVCPPLYKWLTIVGAQLGDVRHFQFGMMYFVYAVFLGVLGRLGWVLGGAALSFAVVAITMTTWIFIGLGFIGGAPRMYAYPLISLVLYSLIRDHPYLLAVTVVLGGLLYPIVAMIGGLCLASWILLRPLSGLGLVSQWALSRRLVTVALTGFLTIAALVPLLVGSAPYGRRAVEADIALYPEAGPDGTYRPYDQLPYRLFGHEWIAYFAGPMYSHGDPIAPWFNVHKQFDRVTSVFVLAVTGLVILLVILRGMRLVLKEDRSGGGIRLISFFVVCGMLHVIAWLTQPYLYIPTRYFMFSLPFLIAMIFPWSLYTLLGRAPQLQSSGKFRNVAFLGIICIYLMAFGGRGNVDFSASSVERSSQPLFDGIAALPNDVLIAGWPIGDLRKVEYVTRRNVFLTWSLHQVLHINFVKSMHERMDAMFEGYLSTDAAPLYRLRQEFGVTHLLIETHHFTDPKQPPEYFAPWRSRIAPRLAEIKGKEYLMNRSLHEKAAIFNQNGLILLDLAKLP